MFDKRENKDRRKKYVIVECFQEIPCNPCEEVCPNRAIVVGPPLTAIPVYHQELCTGCGRCVSACPGLCIYLVEEFAVGRALVTVPYELLPLPEVGNKVYVHDCDGAAIGQGIVRRVKNTKIENGTALVTVEVGEGIGPRVRGVATGIKPEVVPEPVSDLPPDEDYQVCRCEEVCLSVIREVVSVGVAQVPSIRRFTRIGLGICQGKVCHDLLADEVSRLRGMAITEIGIPKARIPMRPIRLEELGS